MDDKKMKADKLIEKMVADRGYLSPEWEFSARTDPDFMEAYNNLYQAGLNDGQALPIKIRELVASGILSYRGQEAAVKAHFKRAIKHGATKLELLEAVQTTIVPGGANTFGTGLKALMGAIDELEKEGIEVR